MYFFFFRITDHTKIHIGQENKSTLVAAKNKLKEDLQMLQNVTLWLHHNGNQSELVSPKEIYNTINNFIKRRPSMLQEVLNDLSIVSMENCIKNHYHMKRQPKPWQPKKVEKRNHVFQTINKNIIYFLDFVKFEVFMSF